MPLMLGSKGKDILQWRASRELVASFQERLGRRLGGSSEEEALLFLRKVAGSLQEELAYEGELARESAVLDEALEAAASPEELKPLIARYRELLSAHFRRRLSVPSLCAGCAGLHDRSAARALALAGERMLALGQGSPPRHALLVSGDRGREEQTLFGENRYLLLHEEESPRCFLFSRQLQIALRELGLLASDQLFWHGALADWRLALAESFDLDARPAVALTPCPPFSAPSRQGPRELPEWEWRLEAISDLLFLRGDAALAAQALELAAATVRGQRRAPAFLQLSRRVIGLPLALGRFGRWRLERDGEHRGELNLEEFARGPLVMTLRVLALYEGVEGRASVERIQALLERGVLSVELSERLLKAYQLFMQQKVLSEIRNEQESAYLNPEEFEPGDEERLRGALEALLNLQKIAYQRMVGQG